MTIMQALWNKVQEATSEVMRWLPGKGYYVVTHEVVEGFQIIVSPFFVKFKKDGIEGVINLREDVLGVHWPVSFQITQEDGSTTWTISSYQVSLDIWSPDFPHVQWSWNPEGHLNSAEFRLSYNESVTYGWGTRLMRDAHGDENVLAEAGFPKRLPFRSRKTVGGYEIPWTTDFADLAEVFTASQLEKLPNAVYAEFEGAVKIEPEWEIEHRLNKVKDSQSEPPRLWMAEFYISWARLLRERKMNPQRFVEIFLTLVEEHHQGFYSEGDGYKERFELLVIRNTSLWMEAVLANMPDFLRQVKEILGERASDLSTSTDNA